MTITVTVPTTPQPNLERGMVPAELLAPNSATGQFSAYGLSHWTVLVVFAIGPLRWSGSDAGRPDRRPGSSAASLRL